VVQKLPGHKTAVLTLDRYGHLFPDDLDAVASALNTAAQAIADELRTIATSSARADGFTVHPERLRSVSANPR
jgi:hypothetical protein